MRTGPTIKQQINSATDAAHKAAASARKRRVALRRKSQVGGENRQRELNDALDGLRGAGVRLRSLSGKAQWPQFDIGEKDFRRLKDASYAIECERRKLRKMLR